MGLEKRPRHLGQGIGAGADGGHVGGQEGQRPATELRHFGHGAAMAAGMSADPRMAMMQQAMQLSPHDLAQLPPERRQKMEAMRAQYAAQYGGAPGYH